MVVSPTCTEALAPRRRAGGSPPPTTAPAVPRPTHHHGDDSPAAAADSLRPARTDPLPTGSTPPTPARPPPRPATDPSGAGAAALPACTETLRPLRHHGVDSTRAPVSADVPVLRRCGVPSVEGPAFGTAARLPLRHHGVLSPSPAFSARAPRRPHHDCGARSRSRQARRVSAPGTPSATVHTSAAAPVRHHTGPNCVRSPTPSGPPASAASAAAATPQPTPASAAVSAVSRQPHASSRRAYGGAAVATVNHATAPAAPSGTASEAQATGDATPSPGSAASSGKCGCAGVPATTSGVAVAPVPRAKPGPRPYAAPHTAAFGTRATTSSINASRPDQAPASCRNAPCADLVCHTSEATNSSAPPPTSATTPAPPARTAALVRERARASRTRCGTQRGRGPRGRPQAVHTPAAAAVAATRGRWSAALSGAAGSGPPDA